MELSKWTRITLVIVAGVVLLGLAAISVWSGAELDLGELLSALGPALAGLLAGLGIAGGRTKGAVVLLLVVLPALNGCSTHRAQVAVQSSLTGVAESVAAADRIVAAETEGAVDEAIARARERSVGCTNPEACDPLELYREEMSPWYAATRGLELTAASLRALQDAIDVWVATGELPERIGALCLESGEALGALLELLEVAGVDVPEALASAPGATSAVCVLIAQRVARERRSS